MNEKKADRDKEKRAGGCVFAVGFGPGGYEQMTIEARRVLEDCDVIVGYTTYINLVRPWFGDKEYVSTPMGGEIARCRAAFAKAEKGKTAAMVCSGDAGVYGLAGPLLQVQKDYPDIPVEIVPGVTASLAGAALLGAPLTHDFAVVSLSDLLTDWEDIEQRLKAAAAADFVICLYNPSSKKRADYLQKACDIILQYRSADTVCGIAKNIGREGENTQILSLSRLRDTSADMNTTVFIGSSRTTELNGRMVTPRGYERKYSEQLPENS